MYVEENYIFDYNNIPHSLLLHCRIAYHVCVQERLVSVVYGLLMQSKLHFLTALREGILSHLKTFVKEVSAYCHHPVSVHTRIHVHVDVCVCAELPWWLSGLERWS